MAHATTSSTSQEAPCGRIVACECHHEEDDEGLLINDLFFACGCRNIRHEYHDGTFSQRIVHHNGRVLLDELIADNS